MVVLVNVVIQFAFDQAHDMTYLLICFGSFACVDREEPDEGKQCEALVLAELDDLLRNGLDASHC